MTANYYNTIMSCLVWISTA